MTADLETVSPLLIGTGEDNNLTDTLVLKNKNDMPFIPGTSLAGVLRALDSDLERFFGNISAGNESVKSESQSTYIDKMEETIWTISFTIVCSVF